MKHLSFILIFITATVKTDRVVFPDEYNRISQLGNYYNFVPTNASQALGGILHPSVSVPHTYNYQTPPPPRIPINPKITYRPDANKSKSIAAPPATLSTLANLLPAYWRNHVNDIISRGVLKFSLDMDRSISDTSLTRIQDLEKNVIFSPLSLAGTMAMVLLASGGRTFDEVVQILGLQSGVDISRHSELVHQMFGSLIEQINTKRGPGQPVANYASAIFVQDGFPIRPEYREISEKIYKSQVKNLNFQNNPRYAQAAINDWVRDKTFGKIYDILQYPPSDYTKVILASALYFNGEWNQHFFDFATKRKPFYIEPNRPIEVDMMYNGGEFPFYEDKRLGVKIIGLPYKGHEVTMYLLLPNEEGATFLKRFKRSLTPEMLDYLISNMRNDTCILGVPRVKLSSTLSLKDALKYLGLGSLFDPSTADLSLLSPGQNPSTPVNPNQDYLTSRLSDDDDHDTPTPMKRNLFKYMSGRYDVEQWSSGFRLRRLRRNTQIRQAPQTRSVDQQFLDFVKANQQNFPNYGLDDLRNSHTAVNPQLYADEVLHKVEININERGTEAAAATIVSINRSGDQRTLLANRPFIFFIRHDQSKLIWFWGTVNKPESSYNQRK